MHGTLPLAPGREADARTGRSRRLRARLALAVVAIAVIAAAAFLLLGRKSGVASATKPAVVSAEAAAPVVTVVVPGSTAVTSEVRLTGSIAARRSSPVGVQGEGGMVTAVLVKEGDFVRRGQVLAKIDRAVQAQMMLQMDAAIRSAQADAALAQAELDRARALVARGFISKADIDRKTAARDGALAKVSLSRAQLGEQRARLARLDVRAPSAGVILTRAVEAGQVVGAGSNALFTLAEDGAMELRGRVAEQDLARLHIGQTARVKLVGSGDAFTGRVWLIDPVLDAQARQGIARIALGGDRRLRPGAFANATVAAGSAARPQLPQSAVQSDEAGNYVMIVGADNKIQQRRVEVGEVGDKGLTIRSGLDGSERVVASAAAYLTVGQKVAPVVRSAEQG